MTRLESMTPASLWVLGTTQLECEKLESKVRVLYEERLCLRNRGGLERRGKRKSEKGNFSLLPAQKGSFQALSIPLIQFPPGATNPPLSPKKEVEFLTFLWISNVHFLICLSPDEVWLGGVEGGHEVGQLLLVEGGDSLATALLLLASPKKEIIWFFRIFHGN